MSVTSAASGAHLTEDATKTMIHALVTSRLDYCNAVLYGLPASVGPNQQNAATAEYVRTYDNENKTSRSYHPSAH